MKKAELLTRIERLEADLVHLQGHVIKLQKEVSDLKLIEIKRGYRFPIDVGRLFNQHLAPEV